MAAPPSWCKARTMNHVVLGGGIVWMLAGLACSSHRRLSTATTMGSRSRPRGGGPIVSSGKEWTTQSLMRARTTPINRRPCFRINAEETSSKVKKPPVQMTSALEVWKSYEGVFWGMNYRGDLRQDSDANPLKVVAITQSHNISELLGRPLEQPINMRNRASPFIPEIDFYGQVDMSRVSVVHITNVDNPNEVATKVKEEAPDVLLMDFHMTPWTGDTLMDAIVKMAKRTPSYPRPRYILGISESQALNRDMVDKGADGFIKKQMLHGWDQWPKQWPEAHNATERVLPRNTQAFKEAKEAARRNYEQYLRELQASGEMEQYNDILGYRDFIRDHYDAEAVDAFEATYEKEKIFYDFLGFDRDITEADGKKAQAVEARIFGRKKRIYANQTLEDLKEDDQIDDSTPQAALRQLEEKLQSLENPEEDAQSQEEKLRRREEEEERVQRIKEKDERKKEKEEAEKYYP